MFRRNLRREIVISKDTIPRALAIMVAVAFAPAVFGQQVTFAPYIQLGDNGPLHATDQIVVAWQTNETSPKASAYKVEVQQSYGGWRSVVPQVRVIDNYLAADAALPAVAGAYRSRS